MYPDVGMSPDYRRPDPPEPPDSDQVPDLQDAAAHTAAALDTLESVQLSSQRLESWRSRLEHQLDEIELSLYNLIEEIESPGAADRRARVGVRLEVWDERQRDTAFISPAKPREFWHKQTGG